MGRGGIKQVPDGLGLLVRANLPIKTKNDFEDSDVFGFYRDSEQTSDMVKLGIQDALNCNGDELETYGEDTQEWKEAQLMYGQQKETWKGEYSYGLVSGN